MVDHGLEAMELTTQELADRIVEVLDSDDGSVMDHIMMADPDKWTKLAGYCAVYNVKRSKERAE